MSYDSREPYSRRYDEEDERPTRSLDRGRYESGRYSREPARSEYGGYRSREYDRDREYEGFGRDPYPSGYSDVPLSGRQIGARKGTILFKLGDVDLGIPDRDDLRGRTVFDQHGNDIGDVSDLIVDQEQRRVRFLLVTSGGFLGIGGTMMLIPIEAITRVTNKVVAIDQAQSRGFGSVYNPTLIDRRSEWYDYQGSDRKDQYRGWGRSYGNYYSGSGQHRGRGPRGYRRSDDRIREEISDRFSDRGDLDASEIEVVVTNAEVTLTGTVENRRDKRLAEDIAEDVSGVQNVENRLRVSQSLLGTSTDRYDTTTTATERPNTGTTTSEAAKASR